MEVTFDSSIEIINAQPLNPDEIEFAPSVDDCPAILEFRNEVEPYNPNKIVPKSGCGGFLDLFG